MFVAQSSAPTVAAKAHYADTFTRANAADLGTDWISRGGAFKVASNVAVVTTINQATFSSWAAPMSTDDHSLSVSNSGNTTQIGLYLRGQNGVNVVYALFRRSSNKVIIYTGTGAYATSTDTLRAQSASSYTYTTGDVLYFEAVGNVYTAKKNGTTVVTWTDSGGVNTANVGPSHREVAVYSSGASNTGFDNFTADDL